MASEKQQGSVPRSNGGAQPDRGLHERVQDVTGRMQDRVDTASQRLHEGYESARQSVARGYERSRGMVAEHPTSSVLIGFGLGFGLGLLLTVLLTEQERERWYERYLPDSLHHLPDRLGDYRLPEAISKHLSRS